MLSADPAPEGESSGTFQISIGDSVVEILEHEPGVDEGPPAGQFVVRDLIVTKIEGSRVTLRLPSGKLRTVSTKEPRRAYILPNVLPIANRAITMLGEAHLAIDGLRGRRDPQSKALIAAAALLASEARGALTTIAKPIGQLVETRAAQPRLEDHDLDIALAAAIAAGEGDRLEFKASLLWGIDDARPAVRSDEGERVAAAEVSSFANSHGGQLLFGVNDEGDPIGIGVDLERLPRVGKYKSNLDGWQLRFRAKVTQYLGADANGLIDVTWIGDPASSIARIAVSASSTPVFFRDGDRVDLYVRMGNECRRLKIDEAVRYAFARFRPKV